MDYKLIRESFCVKETLLDASYNQAVELDCILPDYYPEIFKILNLRIKPSVVKHSVNQTKLNYELLVQIKMIYLSEDGTVSELSQDLTYNKSVDLPYSVKSPCISISPYSESESVRVVNKRRVDIRGIVGIDVLVTSSEQRQAISQAYNGGLQLKKSLITYPSKRLCITKRITVVDEVEMGAKDAMKTLLRADACVTSCDKKVISGKLLTKGEAEVTALYIEENSGEATSIKFSLPFSQICDIEGLDEKYDVFVSACVLGCDVRPLAKADTSKLECELAIALNCLAMKFESAQLAIDAFSTDYETSVNKEKAKIECTPLILDDSHKTKATLTYSEGGIKSVISAGAEATKVNVSHSEASNEAIVAGIVKVYAFAKNDSDKLIYLENSLPFEHKVALTCEEFGGAQVCACVTSASYNLSSSNAMEVICDIKLSGYIFEANEIEYIESIVIDESSPIEGENDCALKLYFAQAGESMWDIAKRCHASVTAISDENEIDGDMITSDGMILIPIC
ncbi:MAG: DUF3794 domain-containing protein [Oscillospiraceae bacterium]|nr:DUF3794 domain-containing protein [Oscillospiraceae bacterium]